jgi:hypothetical protein
MGTPELGIVSRDAREQFSVSRMRTRKFKSERTFMNKELRTFIAFSAFALFGAALPSPAAEMGARVMVPFPFTAGTVSLPAGDYIVTQTTDRIVTITGKGGDAMVMVGPADWSPGSTTCALTFARTSRGNMLKEVQTAGSTSDLVKERSSALK